MRVFTAVSVVVVGALGASFFCVRPAGAVPGPTPSKFVGTALSTITFNDGQNQFSFPAIGTIHADGTLTISDGEDFVPGELSVIDGVARGSWTMIGPDTLKAVTVYHAFDANGSIAFTGRNDFTLTLADGEAYEAAGTGTTRVYLPGQDPFDLDAGIIIGGYTITTTRIYP